MDPWIDYFFFRFKPFISLFVITGISVSASTLDLSELSPLPLIACFLFLFLVAFLLRLNNDEKDIAKDEIAHPERPLPSGNIGKKDCLLIIKYLKVFLVALSVLLLIFAPIKAKLMLIITLGYLWLILHDFYTPDFLKRNLLLKAVCTQGFIIPLVFLAIAIASPDYLFSKSSFSFAILLFGAFFTYDICRKLDPYGHPISLAYIHYWGYLPVFWLAVLTLLISAVGAYFLGVAMVLWPLEICVFIFLTYLFNHPKKFKAVDIAAAFSLVIHSWSGVLS